MFFCAIIILTAQIQNKEKKMEKDKIILYQEDDRNVSVDVVYRDETFWLTQKSMAELFEVTKQSISYHLNNVF